MTLPSSGTVKDPGTERRLKNIEQRFPLGVQDLADAVFTAGTDPAAIHTGDAAGGVLGGTYPNPSFAADMATQAELDSESSARAAADALKQDAATAVADGDAAGGGLNGTYPNPGVNYGTTGTTACVGNDSRLSDARTPTGTAGGDLTGTYPNPTFAAPTYQASVIALTPSLYWTLNSGTAATDQSGNGRNGTGAGGISIGGFSGNPIYGETTSTDLDGVDDLINVSYSPYTNGTTRTFCGWANRDTSTSADGIFGSPNNTTYLMLSSGSNNVVFDPNNAGGAGVVTWTNAWPGNGQWVFWALVFNEATDAVSLYINGALVSTQTHTDAYNGGNIRLGTGAFGFNPFDGKQAHFAVFESGLTDAQIHSLYVAGISGFLNRLTYGAIVPYYMAGGDTFVVPQDRQMNFTEPITLDGTANLVVDGALVDVNPVAVF